MFSRPFLLLLIVTLAACHPLPHSLSSPPPAPLVVVDPSPCLPLESRQTPLAPPLRGQLHLHPAKWEELPGWETDPLDGVLLALQRACPSLIQQYPEWHPFCESLSSPIASSPPKLRSLLTRHLTPWALTARLITGEARATGLLTGYYEPTLAASRTPAPGYETPIHAPPPDLITVALVETIPETKHLRLKGRVVGQRLIPYWTRREIVAQGDRFPAPILFWVKDPLDLLIAQTQGSARLSLPDGTHARIGYADHNGHPYRSIARLLIDRGELPPHRATLDAIRAWFERHPHQRDQILAENPAYVFFRELPPPADPYDGPIGTLGVPLVAGRSVAIDPALLPLGAPLWLSAPEAPQPLHRLVVAHDTGGAILGPLRGDYYWGSGAPAGYLASRTRAEARWWLLWPRGVTPSLSGANAP
ncbi:MAG: murein transglycosylase A [Hydrogenophilus sp.]|nr:murein transglycosylase A [Hydrogenophilus sp.]